MGCYISHLSTTPRSILIYFCGTSTKEYLGPVYMEWGTPVWWGWFLLISRSGGHTKKETYPTRPGSPTPCKQGLRYNISQPPRRTVYTLQERIIILICTGRKVLRSLLKGGGQRCLGCQHDSRDHCFVVLLYQECLLAIRCSIGSRPFPHSYKERH